MSSVRKNLFNSQTIESIRQELTLAELTNASCTEYLSLLAKHTRDLISLLDKFINRDNTQVSISELYEAFNSSFVYPICVVDDKLKVTHYNSSWKNLFGAGKSVLHLSKFFDSHDIENLKSTLVNSDKEMRQSFVQLKNDISKYLVSVLPIRTDDYAISLLMFLTNEELDEINHPKLKFISEVKSYSETLSEGTPEYLSEEENMYKTMIDSLDGFALKMDSAFKIIWASDQLRAKLGYYPEELLGRSIDQILSREDTRKLQKAKKDLKSGILKTRIELNFEHKDKSLRVFDINLSKLGKQEDLIFALALEIQQGVEKVKQLEEAKRKAEENDKLKSDFLANMSHEIRTPLNGIVGFATMLDNAELTKEKKEKFLRIIRSSSNHLLALVNDIIDFSRIEASQLQLVFSKTDINLILDELHTTFTEEVQRLSKNSLHIRKYQVNIGEKMYMITDEVRLKQILSNLLNNAIKFTEAGVVVFGYTKPKDDEIRFFVRDTGMGLPNSDQEMIFGRHNQTCEGGKIKYKGSGLGLAISKGIVELMGGHIGVVSQPGKGSEFYFTLPYNT